MFGDIMIMFFCVWVLFMVSIIDDITGKKNKEKTEEVGMEK